jgi:hypothetical protein
LLAVGGGYFFAGVGMLSLYGLNIVETALIPMAVSAPFLISGITLMVYSALELSSIAKVHNKFRPTSHFPNGLQLNYGLIGNGIGLKLRF